MRVLGILGIFFWCLVLVGCGLSLNQAAKTNPVDPDVSVHSFTLPDIDGTPVDLSQYKGRVLLIVNTASKCGLTSQLGDLQRLYEDYRFGGLEVLGFPCNDFFGQEPGNEETIKGFCTGTYKVEFPLFSKVNAKGTKTALYRYLTEEGPVAFRGEIRWNFDKFLVDGDGRVVNRFSPRTNPRGEEVIQAIEAELAKL
jgi:glutathione peroxidase